MENSALKRLFYDIGKVVVALSLLLLWFFLKPENIPLTVLIWGLTLFFLHFFEIKIPFFNVYLFYPLLLSAVFSLNLTTATLVSLFAPLKKSDVEEGKSYREALFRLTDYVIAVQACGWIKRFLKVSGYPSLSWIFIPLVFFLLLFLFLFLERKLSHLEIADLPKKFLPTLLIGTLFSYLLFFSYLFSGIGGLLSFLILASIFISFYESYRLREEKLLSSFFNLANSLDEKVLHQKGKTKLVFEEGKKLLNRFGEKNDEALWAMALFNLGLLPFASIIRRESRLTREEFLKVKERPVILAEALREEEILSKAADIIRNHHESFSGTGYPEGKIGEAVPLTSRIIHLLQAYAAMISPRPYRKAFDEERALKEIEHFSGVQFDSEIAKKFLSLRRGKGEE